ncbi:hypothetical protein [Paracidovorax konjaci]|nr:hypothetical protein [Paracidovorax konjaci]
MAVDLCLRYLAGDAKHSTLLPTRGIAEPKFAIAFSSQEDG